MKNKKKFTMVATLFIYLLSFSPIESFSESINNNAENHRVFGLYFAGQYKPSISHFSDFSVKETNVDTLQLVKLKKDSTPFSTDMDYIDFEGLYVAKFQNNAISFSGAIGYSNYEGLRFEIEGSYEKFDVKNPGGYVITEAYRYFALAREMDDDHHPESNSYTIMKNNGLFITSIMINGCYDFSLDELAISPYICLGIGENFIEFFDTLSVKLAYQGKLGVNYYLSPRISLFADGYYHNVIGNKFKKLNVYHIVELTDFPKSTSAVATLNIGYFGGEIGVRFIF